MRHHDLQAPTRPVKQTNHVARHALAGNAETLDGYLEPGLLKDATDVRMRASLGSACRRARADGCDAARSAQRVSAIRRREPTTER
jgi:hypothetical protein